MAIPIPSDGSLAPRRPTWGIPDALIGYVVVYIAAVIIGAAIFATAGYSDDPLDSPLIVQFVANLPLWLGILGLAIGVSAYKGNGWIADYHVALKAWDVPIGIGAGLLAQLVLVPLIAWPVLELSGKSADDLAKVAEDLGDKVHNPADAIVFIVVVGLIAPICEEVFFRGLLFRSFEKRLGAWWALGLSSVLFAATHGQLLQFVPLIAAGAVFGYLVVRTGRLGPAIVAHTAFNLTTVVSLLWLT